MEKLNIEKEFKKALQSVDYDIMLKKCRKFKVKIKKRDNLADLCKKYLIKKTGIADYKIEPMDFLNTDDIIEDIVAEIIVADAYDRANYPKLLYKLLEVIELFIVFREMNNV